MTSSSIWHHQYLGDLLKRSILHDRSKIPSELKVSKCIQDSWILPNYQRHKCKTLHTCLTSLDDKNIRYLKLSSQYNCIAKLTHRVFIPVESSLRGSKSDLIHEITDSRIFTENRALSVSSFYRCVTSCKKSKKSLEPFLRKTLTNQPTNYIVSDRLN